jgi:hypothetical protein
MDAATARLLRGSTRGWPPQLEEHRLAQPCIIEEASEASRGLMPPRIGCSLAAVKGRERRWQRCCAGCGTSAGGPAAARAAAAPTRRAGWWAAAGTPPPPRHTRPPGRRIRATNRPFGGGTARDDTPRWPTPGRPRKRAPAAQCREEDNAAENAGVEDVLSGAQKAARSAGPSQAGRPPAHRCSPPRPATALPRRTAPGGRPVGAG